MSGTSNSERTILTIDSTLRDGEQAAGVYFTIEEKKRLAKALDDAGVTMLDAGFPVVSGQEAEAFRQIASMGLKAKTFATVRPDAAEIELAHELGAKGVFLFFPISKILTGLIRSITIEQFEEQIQKAVKLAHEKGMEVIVVLEDAGRAGIDAENEIIELLQKEGIDTFIVAESVGSLTPRKMIKKITRLRELFPDIILGVHCHDDFGLGTANSLAAIEAGATYFSGTVAGLGERAGNASLEEAVVCIRNLLGCNTDVRPEALYELCLLVEELSGIVISPVKAVCGSNTFRCESGLHSRALLRKEGSYEPFPPELVGQERSFVLGKHSGMECLMWMLEQRNVTLEPEQKEILLQKIKSYRETEKGSTMRDFIVSCRGFYQEHFSLSDETFDRLLAEVKRG